MASQDLQMELYRPGVHQDEKIPQGYSVLEILMQ